MWWRIVLCIVLWLICSVLSALMWGKAISIRDRHQRRAGPAGSQAGAQFAMAQVAKRPLPPAHEDVCMIQHHSGTQ